MSRIDGNPPPTITNPQEGDFDLTIKGKEGDIKISVDNSFGTGKADPETKLTVTYGMIEATVSSSDLATLLASLRTKTEEANLKTSSENVQAIKEKKLSASQQRLHELDEIDKKIQDAKKSDKIGKIFGWIAAGAMILAGALLMVAGGAGAALIIAGAAMMTVMALQESGAMEQIMEGLTKFGTDVMGLNEEQAARFATAVVATVVIAVAVAATIAGGPAAGMAVASTGLSMLATPENLVAMGVDEEKAGPIAMGISIGLAVLALGAGAGSAAGSSGKIAQLAAKGNKIAMFMKGFASGGKLAGVSTKLAGNLSQNAITFAKFGSYVALGINGAATVGGGATAIDSASKRSEAMDKEADLKELEAFLAKLQAMFDDESEKIEEIMARLEEVMSTVMQIMNADVALTSRVNTI